MSENDRGFGSGAVIDTELVIGKIKNNHIDALFIIRTFRVSASVNVNGERLYHLEPMDLLFVTPDKKNSTPIWNCRGFRVPTDQSRQDRANATEHFLRTIRTSFDQISSVNGRFETFMDKNFFKAVQEGPGLLKFLKAEDVEVEEGVKRESGTMKSRDSKDTGDRTYGMEALRGSKHPSKAKIELSPHIRN